MTIFSRKGRIQSKVEQKEESPRNQETPIFNELMSQWRMHHSNRSPGHFLEEETGGGTSG